MMLLIPAMRDMLYLQVLSRGRMVLGHLCTEAHQTEFWLQHLQAIFCFDKKAASNLCHVSKVLYNGHLLVGNLVWQSSLWLFI